MVFASISVTAGFWAVTTLQCFRVSCDTRRVLVTLVGTRCLFRRSVSCVTSSLLLVRDPIKHGQVFSSSLKFMNLKVEGFGFI